MEVAADGVEALFGLLAVAEPLRWFLLRRKQTEATEAKAKTDTQSEADDEPESNRRTPESSLHRGVPSADTPDPGIRTETPSAHRDVPADRRFPRFVRPAVVSGMRRIVRRGDRQRGA